MTPRLSTLTDIVRTGADRFPDRVALQSARAAGPAARGGADDLTYSQLRDRVRRLGRALRARGLDRGDRVLLTAPASPDWLVAFFGILDGGLVVVPVPEAVGAPLVAAVAAHTGARLCLTGPRQHDLAAAFQGVPCAAVAALLDGHGFDGDGGVDPGGAGTGGDDRLAVLAFTSGSTSRPRAVELTHANLIANLRSLLSARGSTEPETLLSMLPPAHLFELVVGQLAPLAVGGRIVYAGTLLPNRLVDAIRAHEVTRVLVVPALLDALCREVVGSLIEQGAVPSICRDSSAVSMSLKLRRLDSAALGRLRQAVRGCLGARFRAVGLGGAAIGPGWSEVLGAAGVTMDVGYGLTEAGPLVSLGWAADCPAGSVGRALPGVDVRIDANGEILVRGAGVMRGYFASPAMTAGAIDDGWLRTGDRGHLDAAGFLYIAGRTKEVIVTPAGDTLHPEEIEPYYASRIFAEHCVAPVPGPDGNDVPVLVAVPKQRDVAAAVVDREFDDLRAAAPPRYRVAAMLRRDQPLPRTLLGKLKRRELGNSLAPLIRTPRPVPVPLEGGRP
jgi:long-chain acyl-CoA synthetase